MKFSLKTWKKLAAVGVAVVVGFAVTQQRTPATEPGRTVAYTLPTGVNPMLSIFKKRSIDHVDESNFAAKVLKSDVPVVVDFYADWCGPCKMLAPVLSEFAQETPNARVVKVNIDHSPNLADYYGVSSIPTLLVFRNGKATAHHQGLANKNTLKSLVRR
jgi:thioredoxin 1